MFANKGNINIAVMLRHFFFDHENRFYPNTCDTPFLDCESCAAAAAVKKLWHWIELTPTFGSSLFVATDMQQHKDAMAERLRKKAELQKKTALPATYKDSLSREMEKKTEMNAKSKEERRNAMCEELGRGC
jgi:hypothetical protein